MRIFATKKRKLMIFAKLSGNFWPCEFFAKTNSTLAQKWLENIVRSKMTIWNNAAFLSSLQNKCLDDNTATGLVNNGYVVFHVFTNEFTMTKLV